jgi:hypothetical protein
MSLHHVHIRQTTKCVLASSHTPRHRNSAGMTFHLLVLASAADVALSSADRELVDFYILIRTAAVV